MNDATMFWRLFHGPISDAAAPATTVATTRPLELVKETKESVHPAISGNSTNNNESTLQHVSSIRTETTSTAASALPVNTLDWHDILKTSTRRALGGGQAGAAAAIVQVCSLMWLRTSMNYQYRYGGNLQSSLRALWAQGGLARLYQGLPFALLQVPLTRFGDTAANVGVLTLLESFDVSHDWPLPVKTACASIAASAWRMVLMPIDASKVAMQVEGVRGLRQLQTSLLQHGPRVLYQGSLAQAAATTAAHFPWFLTYNFLNERLPPVAVVDDDSNLFFHLLRAAVMGLGASCVSDCVSNSLRVLKTTKQTARLSRDGKDISYAKIARRIIRKDGIIGLMGRGLGTRLLCNAIQGAVFSVCWKYFQHLKGL